MENNNLNLHTSGEGSTSNIIFGTSSDAIEEGLHNGDFMEAEAEGFNPDDKNQIVNEQDQNEIVNPSEENFNEEITPEPPAKDNTLPVDKTAALPEVPEKGTEPDIEAQPIVSKEK